VTAERFDLTEDQIRYLEATLASRAIEYLQRVGFLDAADWHQENTKAGGGLPGTANGAVTDGGAYAISLITTQGATNIKNDKRNDFKDPSRNTLINRIMEETTGLSETDEGILQLKELRSQYGPRAKEKGLKWIELYAAEKADEKLAALKAQRDGLPDAGAEATADESVAEAVA
jgi:hypothetical protein